jgi:hypothetical protein
LADKNSRKPSECLTLAAIFPGRRNNNSRTQKLQSAASSKWEQKTERMDTMTIIDIFIAALWVAMFYGVARDIKKRYEKQ